MLFCRQELNTVGLYVSNSAQVEISGNVFEGNGGPGLVTFGTFALSVISNYVRLPFSLIRFASLIGERKPTANCVSCA